MLTSRLRALCLSGFMAALPLTPAAAQDGMEWWVIVGYVDHPPMEWDDAVLAKGNLLNARLAQCGLSAFWDFAGKFDGFATKGRGSVFVVATDVMLTKKAASAILSATKPCVGDAYIKQARYFGE